MQTKPRSRVASAAASASWMALVAATTLGIGQLDRVRAQVSSGRTTLLSRSGGTYRLIVQSYASQGIEKGQLPAPDARPLGSAQRAITAEELAAGISVDIVQLGETDEEASANPVVVAWIEPGDADLEYDALRARPGRDAIYAVAHASREADQGSARAIVTLG